MKNFPPDFISELIKKTGITPCLILRQTIDGTVYNISDSIIPFPLGALNGFTTTLDWVADWGGVKESISGNIGEILVADLNLTLLVDQADENNIRHLALQHELEKSLSELFLWLPELDATLIPPQRIFCGHIDDIDLPDETQVTVVIVDETVSMQDYLGTKITSETHPLCDPDVVGHMIPIVFGSVEKLPGLCVDSGWITSTVDYLDATTTKITVSELPTGSAAGKTIVIDDEQMLVLAQGGSAPRENVALAASGATVTATSSFSTVFPPDKIIDGNSSASGGSWKPPTSHTLPQWIFITLPFARMVDQVKLYFAGYAVASFNIWTRPTVGGTLAFQANVAGNALLNTTTDFAPVSATVIGIELQSNPAGGAMGLYEAEVFGYGDTPGNKEIKVLRAQGGTKAAEHTERSTIVEKKATPLVYLLSDIPLDAIGDVFARIRGIDIDITEWVVKYPGSGAFAPGGQLAAYPGKAALAIADFATVSSKIAIKLENTLAVNQGSHTHPSGSATTNISFDTFNLGGIGWGDPTHQPDKLIDGSEETYASVNAYGGHTDLTRVTAVSNTTKTVSARLALTLESQLDNLCVYWIKIYGVTTIGMYVPKMTKGTIYSPSFTVPSWAVLTSNGFLKVTVEFRASTTYLKIYEASLEVTTATSMIPASAATGVSLMGSLGLSGNSVADVMVGEQVMANVTHNVTAPADVFDFLLTNYCNDTSLTLIGTLPASYKFNGVINEYKKKIEWLDLLAFQCRCWYRKISGVSKLIVRSATPVNPTVIPACCLTSDGIKALRYKKAPKTDVINVINGLYNRDWSSTKAKNLSYKSALPRSNKASIDNYGRLEQPDMFMFDFVTNLSMASDVIEFYHDFYAVRKWLATFPTFLNWAHLEFADDVQLGFANDLVGVITEAGLQLGSDEQMPTMNFIVATTKIPEELANGMHTLLGEQIHTLDGEAITYV